MSISAQFKARCEKAACRSCGGGDLRPVLDLGMMPLVDRLLTSETIKQPEPMFPLDVAFCPSCTLVQILETVPPEILFAHDYPYYSSFSETLLKHSRENALDLIVRRGLNEKNLVVELASNDGYLLKNFVEKGVPVQGIDPAPGPAAAAEKIGVPTMNQFFGLELARKFKAQGRQADVVIGNNVLAHVADTNGFVAGIRTLLKDNGVAVLEFPYVRDLIDHGEFDTIYHEHLCYFSAHSVAALFKRHGLHLNDVKRVPIHGGSLRVYFEPVDRPGAAVTVLLAEERSLGLDKHDYFARFAERVESFKLDALELLKKVKSSGARLAAYGAPAKGAVLLNYLGIGPETIDFTVDRNVHKQGKFMPGRHIPIHPPEKLAAEMPEYAVILPWNFRDEIVRQQQAYREKGGRFIVPIPKLEVVEPVGVGA